jgi:hypothetical protein
VTIAKLVELLGGPTMVIFVGGIIAAIGAVWAAYDQTKSSKQLQEKSEEIARLNRETANTVTGGDSFCYLMPIGNAPDRVSVIHSGKYPLYDVSVQLVDLDDPAFSKPTFSSIGANTITIGNIPPNSIQVLGSVIKLTGDRKRLNIFFSARNGFYTQQLRMRLVNGEWKSATRVTRNLADGKRETLHTQVQPEYPKENDGSVDWK